MSTIPDGIESILQHQPKWFEWYYWLLAPSPATPNASLKEREEARRGRLASVIIMVSLLISLSSLVSSLRDPQETLATPILLLAVALLVIGLISNKLGHVTVAGILCVVSAELGISIAIICNPAGMTVWTLSMFSILVQPELFAVSLLPPRSVFVIALANICFFVCFFYWAPHAPDLVEQLRLQGNAILIPPSILQVVIAVITYLWVRSADQAIRKADRAEEIANLQHELLEHQQVNEQHRQELDYTLAVIENIHRSVANGDLSARVPLTENNSLLLSVGGKFNILLQRYQRTMQSEAQLAQTLQRMIHGIQENTNIIEQSQRPGKLRVELHRSTTPLDSLLLAFEHLLNHRSS